MLLAAAVAAVVDGAAERSVAFSPGDVDVFNTSYPCFRIPALKRLKGGGLIAFAEARRNSLPRKHY